MQGKQGEVTVSYRGPAAHALWVGSAILELATSSRSMVFPELGPWFLYLRNGEPLNPFS